MIGSGGAAAESREQAEADEPGAGGASEEPALARPQEPRMGGVPHQGALPHLRGQETHCGWTRHWWPCSFESLYMPRVDGTIKHYTRVNTRF